MARGVKRSAEVDPPTWRFLPEDRILGAGPSYPEAITALCKRPGPVVCRLQRRGGERVALEMADARGILDLWALWCATEALERLERQGFPPDRRSLRALEVKRAWLQELRKVDAWERGAARANAWDAVHDASRIAAEPFAAATAAAIAADTEGNGPRNSARVVIWATEALGLPFRGEAEAELCLGLWAARW